MPQKMVAMRNGALYVFHATVVRADAPRAPRTLRTLQASCSRPTFTVMNATRDGSFYVTAPLFRTSCEDGIPSHTAVDTFRCPEETNRVRVTRGSSGAVALECVQSFADDVPTNPAPSSSGSGGGGGSSPGGPKKQK
jgi:hypothetical protein